MPNAINTGSRPLAANEGERAQAPDASGQSVSEKPAVNLSTGKNRLCRFERDNSVAEPDVAATVGCSDRTSGPADGAAGDSAPVDQSSPKKSTYAIAEVDPKGETVEYAHEYKDDFIALTQMKYKHLSEGRTGGGDPTGSKETMSDALVDATPDEIAPDEPETKDGAGAQQITYSDRNQIIP